MREDADADGFSAADVARTLGADMDVPALQDFRVRLRAANQQMNLVGPSAEADFWRRHVLDSAQLLTASPDTVTWADLGAGAGFPGLVLAVMLKSQPGAQVHLVESQRKRCLFLQSVVDALALPAQVHWARAESMDAPVVQMVTARACAPLARLFGYALPFTRRGASCLFLKGRSVDDEMTEARKIWRFRAQVLPSLSDDGGRLLRVEALARG